MIFKPALTRVVPLTFWLPIAACAFSCGGQTAGSDASDGARSESIDQGSGGSTGPYEDPPFHCFPAGTHILTETGQVPIERLRVGDPVFGYDVERQERVLQVIERTVSRPDQPLLSLALIDGRFLRATAEHPFFVPEIGEYLPLVDLAPNTALLSVFGEPSALLSTLGLASTGAETVFNLTVSGTHNYFAEGILVHNKSPDECPYNPSLCPPEVDPIVVSPWCIPPVVPPSGEVTAWASCGGDVSAGPLSLKPEPVGGEGGIALGGASSIGGQGGAGAEEPAFGAPARVGTRLCEVPLNSDSVRVLVRAASSAVAGSLTVTTGFDVCSGASQGSPGQSLSLQAGQEQEFCFGLASAGDHLRLGFESELGVESELQILAVLQGTCL